MQQRERGFSLVEIMVVLCIVGILATVFIPNVMKVAEAGVQDNAASQLAAILGAEASYAHYGAYVPLNYLPGAVGQNISCSNPMLLSGAQANQPPTGYQAFTPVFSGSVPSAMFSCTNGPQVGYSGFAINLNPNIPQERSFYACVGTACANPLDSGIIKFAQGQAATESDPAISALASTVSYAGGGGGNPGVGSSTWEGQWNSSSTYTAGDQVYRAASIGGDTCGPAVGGNVGVFVYLGTQGGNDDPCQDVSNQITTHLPGNWMFTGGGLSYTQAAILQGTVTLNGSNPSGSANAPPITQTYNVTNFSVSIPQGGGIIPGQWGHDIGVNVEVWVGQQAFCYIPPTVSSCSVHFTSGVPVQGSNGNNSVNTSNSNGYETGTGGWTQNPLVVSPSGNAPQIAVWTFGGPITNVTFNWSMY